MRGHLHEPSSRLVELLGLSACPTCLCACPSCLCPSKSALLNIIASVNAKAAEVSAQQPTGCASGLYV